MDSWYNVQLLRGLQQAVDVDNSQGPKADYGPSSSPTSIHCPFSGVALWLKDLSKKDEVEGFDGSMNQRRCRQRTRELAACDNEDTPHARRSRHRLPLEHLSPQRGQPRALGPAPQRVADGGNRCFKRCRGQGCQRRPCYICQHGTGGKTASGVASSLCSDIARSALSNASRFCAGRRLSESLTSVQLRGVCDTSMLLTLINNANALQDLTVTPDNIRSRSADGLPTRAAATASGGRRCQVCTRAARSIDKHSLTKSPRLA